MQVKGFSKLSKKDKISWLAAHYLQNDAQAVQILTQYWNDDVALQELHDGFVENTISNFYLPYGIAPNFLIDDTVYAVPMVIEESSVVAASAKAAKFWMDLGGFKTKVFGTEKKGHIHFTYDGEVQELLGFFRNLRKDLFEKLEPVQENMKQRGGGVTDINLIDRTGKIPNYYQFEFDFETVDSMGANFINTILETAADFIKDKANDNLRGELEIIMSILSNYNPGCVVRAQVSCPVDQLQTDTLSGKAYAEKFIKAIQIAENEVYRAVTHNKGIMNGVDAVVLATGNDFRAVEASVHAYASKNGSYQSLSHAKVESETFTFWLDLPLALGTVGGLTGIHPLVKFSLQLLQNPSAQQLMRIVASVGLAQNFAAINSLITHGIQKGHMKMHLNNMLTLLQVTDEERRIAEAYFADKTVSFSALKKLLHRN